jgi:hypothetical protein
MASTVTPRSERDQYHNGYGELRTAGCRAVRLSYGEVGDMGESAPLSWRTFGILLGHYRGWQR